MASMFPVQITSAGKGVDMVFSFWTRKPTERQTADSRLIPARHVVSTMHGTRTVLMDSRSGHYYGLDEVGTRIWQLAEQGVPPARIVAELANEYDAEPDHLRQDVASFLEALKQSRL